MADIAVDGMDKGLDIMASVCELSKAFDSVNVSILLRKLEYYDFGINTLNLLFPYLS